uniref:Peptidase S1 domain-containing protein n=1 Tax=Ditylenchus dipsaci TaxID=166011 RepID=A0A915DYQ4_9BILA
MARSLPASISLFFASICLFVMVAGISAQTDKQVADEKLCLQKCGQMEPTKDDPTARIIGGHSSPDHSFPFVVCIEGISSCGVAETAERFTGFIIDELWILTAAHPLYIHKSQLARCPAFEYWGPMSPTWLLRPVERVKIYPGINDVENIPPGFETVIPMQIYIKTGFNPAEQNVMLNDVALLKLAKRLDIGSETMRKELAMSDFEQIDLDGNAKKLKFYTIEKKLEVVAYAKKAKSINSPASATMLIGSVFANGWNRKSCSGDSGAPLMSFKDGRWYATGVASSIQTMGYTNKIIQISTRASQLIAIGSRKSLERDMCQLLPRA